MQKHHHHIGLKPAYLSQNPIKMWTRHRDEQLQAEKIELAIHVKNVTIHTDVKYLQPTYTCTSKQAS